MNGGLDTKGSTVDGINYSTGSNSSQGSGVKAKEEGAATQGSHSVSLNGFQKKIPSPGPDYSDIPQSAKPADSRILPIPSNPLIEPQNPLKLSYPASTPPVSVTTSRTPSVFQFKKLRSGKWLQEEDEYANFLITLFESGCATDCENGMTLRAYLSQKLHCAPMRISKKFAGKGIGKLVYISKLTSSPESTIEAVIRNERQLKFLEDSFYKAAAPDARRAAPVKVPQYPPPPVVASAPMIHGTVPLVAPPLSLATLPNASMQFASAAANPSATLSVGWPPVMAGNPLISIPTNAAGVPMRIQIPLIGTMPAPTPAPQPGPMPAPPLVLPKIPLPPPVVVTAAAPASVSRPLPESTSSKAVPALPAADPPKLVESRKKVSPGAKTQVQELPDFLAGFDQVAKASTELTNALSRDAHEYSPPFTSKSFDDFHRFLGKDLDEIPQANAVFDQPSHSTAKIHGRPNEKLPAAKDNADDVPDPMALFSAASYVKLAEEATLRHGNGSSQRKRGGEDPNVSRKTPNGVEGSVTGSSFLADQRAVTTFMPAYGQVVGNPLTKIAPNMDQMKQQQMLQSNIVSGSEKTSSSDPLSNNEADSSANESGQGALSSVFGSSDGNSNDSNDSEGSSDCGGNDEDGPLSKKRRLTDANPNELGKQLDLGGTAEDSTIFFC